MTDNMYKYIMNIYIYIYYHPPHTPFFGNIRYWAIYNSVERIFDIAVSGCQNVIKWHSQNLVDWVGPRERPIYISNGFMSFHGFLRKKSCGFSSTFLFTCSNTYCWPKMKNREKCQIWRGRRERERECYWHWWN